MSRTKSWQIRLQHMINAIKDIQSFTRDMDAEDFYHDKKTIYAVERCFSVMGEASKHIPEDIKSNYLDIEWLDIRDMRNFVSHQYDDIEQDILWDTIQNDLPPLKEKLQKLLEDHND